MVSFCKVTLVGNLGGDPELRYTQSGRPMTTFNVACNRRRTGPDGQPIEETDWFRVITYGKLAETCSSWLSRGRRVLIDGRLQLHHYETPDGQRRFSAEVIAHDMQIIDNRPRPEPQEGGAPHEEASSLDDIPF